MRDPAGPVTVLLVEDDPSDVVMVEEALADWDIPTDLRVAADGVEATEFLRREGEYADAPRPALVLLDLNMPRKSGLEVLADIKRDEDLRTIPVVVFSTSAEPGQVIASYAGHANAYVVKPSDFDDFSRVVRQIDRFYTRTVTRPRD
jgi:CheY-like chemotaxis protein